MKSILTLTIAFFCIHLIYSHDVSYQTPDLKPGTWFECEMEFKNGVPVFRNHWLQDHDNFRSTYLLSVRFTKELSESDSCDRWRYKVLRFKQLNFSGKSENLSINDTWYPDYFNAEFDSIRSSHIGSLLFYPDKQDHVFAYSNKYLGTRILFPVASENGNYYSVYSSGTKNTLAHNIEVLANIIFGIQDLKADKRNNLEWHWIDDVKRNENGDVDFTIHQNGSGSESMNSCKAKLLSNGLPYAFADGHGHTVHTITNASFPLPNEAFLEMVDQRDPEKLNTLQFSDHVLLKAFNPAHLIGQKDNNLFIRSNTNIFSTSLKLKCGVEISLSGRFSDISLFIQPGDSIKLIVLDDGCQIIGNKNNAWWCLNPHKDLHPELIQKAPITAEFKSYLTLRNAFNKPVIKTNGTASGQEFKTAIFDFYNLKSYHYKGIHSFLQAYSQEKMKRLYAAGSPYHSGFKPQEVLAISNFWNFPLYFELNNLYKGQYAYYQMGLNEEPFMQFIHQCGDTILSTDIKCRLNARKQIQKGSTLPFESLLTESNQTFNILPQKGKFALLLLYTVNQRQADFKLLTQQLSKEISPISYRLVKRPFKNSSESLKQTSVSGSDPVYLYGHPEQNPLLENMLVSSLHPVLILYDDKGEIVYSKTFERTYDDNDFSEIYRNEIEEAMVLQSAKTADSRWLYLILFLAAVVFGLLTTLLINRIRSKRLRKRSEREKLIQELKLKSIQSQLNPHFLFNALNSIQSLMNTHRYADADTYLIGLSELLRGVLGNSNKRLVSLEDELKIVQHYCDLEKLRRDFMCTITTQTETDTSLIEVPFMLLQPLVENAIKHGISKTDKQGELRIDIQELDAVLTISILDNGPGIGHTTLDHLKQKGKGLNLTIEKLKSTFGDDCSFSIKNARDQKGTETIIRLLFK